MADRAPRPRKSATFFRELIERRAREGLTWAEAASVGGTSPSTLHRWVQKLRSLPAPEFLELCPSATRAPASPGGIEVVLANGLVLRVPAGSPPEGLVDLVRLLAQTC